MPGKWALLPDGSAVHATDTIIVIEPDEDLEGVELATGRGSGAPLIVKRVSQDSSIGQLYVTLHYSFHISDTHILPICQALCTMRLPSL